MPSIRKKLKENINSSKNTRMDIMGAGIFADWRPDILAHISRYEKIASLAINEAQSLKRPINLLEVGCGQLWPLRVIESAYVVIKLEIIKSYQGYDIDPDCFKELKYWSNSGGDIRNSTWFKKYNTQIHIRDLTVNPTFDCESDTIDFFYTTEVIEHMKPEFVEKWLIDAKRCLTNGGLIYISTPNHNGSRSKLPKDHVYEWGYEELKQLLTKHFTLISHYGTFIQMNNFKKAMDSSNCKEKWTEEQINMLKDRFGHHWQRVILACPFPEYSNNVCWIMRCEK